MYKLTIGWPQRLSDGAFVNPETNQEYLQWLSEGNTPEPADTPPPAPAPIDPVEKLKAFLAANPDVAAVLKN